jgi:hypothetical protein
MVEIATPISALALVGSPRCGTTRSSRPSTPPAEKGKSAKVAPTAVMRKLTVLMNRLLKNPNFILVS